MKWSSDVLSKYAFRRPFVTFFCSGKAAHSSAEFQWMPANGLKRKVPLSLSFTTGSESRGNDNFKVFSELSQCQRTFTLLSEKVDQIVYCGKGWRPVIKVKVSTLMNAALTVAYTFWGLKRDNLYVSNIEWISNLLNSR